MLVFEDFPDFRPNLTPAEIFAGSFGGTYWRPIWSSVVGKKLRNRHRRYRCLDGVPDELLTRTEYDKSLNTYGVQVGTSLEFWEGHGWIKPTHPYGWVEWYCDFYEGKRCADDHRQVQRWLRTAGPNSRFRKRLLNMVRDRGTTISDLSVSPKIRQTLQHWAYRP